MSAFTSCFSVDIKRGAISSVPDCINQGLKHIVLQCGGLQGVVDLLFAVAAERFSVRHDAFFRRYINRICFSGRRCCGRFFLSVSAAGIIGVGQ